MPGMRSPAADLRCVAGQLGRGAPWRLSAPVHRVATRCPWELPAVIESLPYAADGTPFPTLFYITCPTAAAAVGRVEDRGGVTRFAAALAGEGEHAARLRAALRTATRYERRRRRSLGAGPASAGRARALDAGAVLRAGVGGVAQPGALKCLHCHAAHALAWPGYLLGELVLAEAGAVAPLWCDDARCRQWTEEVPCASR